MLQYVLYLCKSPSVMSGPRRYFFLLLNGEGVFCLTMSNIITLNNDGNKLYDVKFLAIFNVKMNVSSEQLLYMENTLTDPFVNADAVGRLAHGLLPGDQL